MWSILSDHSDMKLNIKAQENGSTRKTAQGKQQEENRKIHKYVKINQHPLKHQWVKEITTEIRKYLEKIEN